MKQNRQNSRCGERLVVALRAEVQRSGRAPASGIVGADAMSRLADRDAAAVRRAEHRFAADEYRP